ncbi:mucin-5AC-like [Pseudophryne corroboree]|uniref:mucin-5AC-like n=1 Tax=Pseudophryne corroboree TaxID=495146 RepID=UPI003081E13E
MRKKKKVSINYIIFEVPPSYIIVYIIEQRLTVVIQIKPIMQLYLVLEPSFQTMTCGLCGNFNNIQIDDLKSLGGVVEGTAAAFVNTWKSSALCPNVKNIFDDPCSLSVESEEYAKYWCSQITDPSGALSTCHSKVDPNIYYKNCLWDTCSCEQSEDCMCAAIFSYIKICAAKGITVENWINKACSKYTTLCPESQIFSYMINSYPPTCRSLSELDITYQIYFDPLPGCTCEQGYYMNDGGICVPASACPCYYDGIEIPAGQTTNKDGVLWYSNGFYMDKGTKVLRGTLAVWVTVLYLTYSCVYALLFCMSGKKVTCQYCNTKFSPYPSGSLLCTQCSIPSQGNSSLEPAWLDSIKGMITDITTELATAKQERQVCKKSIDDFLVHTADLRPASQPPLPVSQKRTLPHVLQFNSDNDMPDLEEVEVEGDKAETALSHGVEALIYSIKEVLNIPEKEREPHVELFFNIKPKSHATFPVSMELNTLFKETRLLSVSPFPEHAHIVTVFSLFIPPHLNFHFDHLIEQSMKELDKIKCKISNFEKIHMPTLTSDQDIEWLDKLNTQINQYKRDLIRFKKEKQSKVDLDYEKHTVYKWISGGSQQESKHRFFRQNKKPLSRLDTESSADTGSSNTETEQSTVIGGILESGDLRPGGRGIPGIPGYQGCIPSHPDMATSSGLPQVFTKVMAEMMLQLCMMSVNIVPYLDDLLIKVVSEAWLLESIALTTRLLIDHGWILNLQKSHLVPLQRLQFLGMILDTVSQKVFLPMNKALTIQSMVRFILKPPKILVHLCIRLLGKMVASYEAIQYGRFHAHPFQLDLLDKWSDERKVLTRGLKFAPTSQLEPFGFYVDLQKFIRKLTLRRFFTGKNNDEVGNSEAQSGSQFKPKSLFYPTFAKGSFIDCFSKLVLDDVEQTLRKKRRKCNLTKKEWSALKSLKSDDSIIIKPADKGGGLVLMDKVDCIAELDRQLSDGITYSKIKADPTLKISESLRKWTTEGLLKGVITKDEFDFINIEHPTIPTIYCLPKIHKNPVCPPGRPIVSGVNSVTSNLSMLLDHYLQPLVKCTKSYLKDTGQLLTILDGLGWEENYVLASSDVSTLYTIIEEEKEGIRFILRNNYFVFNGNYYLQCVGTAMGTRFAPSYANLFMAYWEEKAIWHGEQLGAGLVLWRRYIDDILFVWNGDLKDLDLFIEGLNNNPFNIRLTTTISQKEIMYLDLCIYIANGSINTKLYRKPTDSNGFIERTSQHHDHWLDGIPYSQLLRVKRNCTDSSTCESQMGDLCERFLEKGYSKESLAKAQERANTVDRKDLIQGTNQKVSRENDFKWSFITDFNSQYREIESIMKKHWMVLTKDPVLGPILPSKPRFINRRSRSIKDNLVRSSIEVPKRTSIRNCISPMTFNDCDPSKGITTGVECAKSCSTLDMHCYSKRCVPGCVCPPGLLSDDHRGCIPEEQCPCVHNEATYNTGEVIKIPCNTCVCKDRRWECTNNTCLSTCTVYGDGHYITFDGKRFEFNGECQYALAQDHCSGNDNNSTFRVITENIPCGTTGTTCSKSIKVFLEGYEIILVDDHLKVVQRGSITDVPYRVRLMGIFLVFEAKNGLSLIWDKKTSIFIKITEDFKGKLCGLCGNYDGNRMNDFTMRTNAIVGNTEEFGNSWKLSTSCPDATVHRNPCSLNPYRLPWAQKQCGVINSEVFSECHPQVDPCKYYDACVSDSCACNTGGDCECFCTAIAAYAQACGEFDICISWRGPNFCPLFCDYYNDNKLCEWSYRACGVPCMKTCRNPTGICQNELKGLEGCYPECPEDQPYFDEDEMMCVAICGCYDEERKHYKLGANVPSEENCYICNCTMNGIECTYHVESCICEYDGHFYKYNETIYTISKGEGVCADFICKENGTIIEVDYPCATTTATTFTTETKTTTSTYTTTYPSTTTALTSTPTVTSQTTATSQGTPATPNCTSVCEWTEWFDEYEPTFGNEGGDFENLQAIEEAGFQVCQNPSDIECRPKLYPQKTPKELGQHVVCTVSDGLICYNKDQITLSGRCYDYEVRFLCCRNYCTTTSPASTTSIQSTTATTTACYCYTNGIYYAPNSIIEHQQDGFTCYYIFCTDICEIVRIGEPCTTSTTATTVTPQTSTEIPGCPPRKFNETWLINNCTVATCHGYNNVTKERVKCPPVLSHSCPNGAKPYPVYSSDGCCYQIACKTSCVPECSWSVWYDVSYPEFNPNGGDYETYENIRNAGYHLCEKPENISCRAVNFPDIPLNDLGQNLTCDVSYGLICNNKDQDTVTPVCYNYEISVYCCIPLPDYCLTTTVYTSTTSTTQSTTSLTTTPTTTVTTTATTPETTTPTTTKASTTTTQSTTTLVSTSPTTTVTITPEITTTPKLTTIPETSTPSTSTKTTSPTTPSCVPKCSWSQWFDVSYPTNGASGGEYETYENITKAGYHLCEKPENISCRAKQFPDKLDKLGQKVTCDVSYGLICNNKDQDGVVPLCHNYEISVYCCLPLPSYCLTTTPLTTTTTTQSTTTSASPTTTVTKTTTSPETSTPTTTKATTTSTQSTTSTSPTTTVTKTTTSPETSTPTTTKTTTSTRSTATSTSPTTTVTTTTTSPETSTPTTTKTTTSTQSTTSTSPTTTVTKTTTSPETSTPTTTKTTTTSTQSTTSTSPTTTVTKTTTSPETSTPTTTKTTTSTRSTATSTSPTTTVTTTTTSPETSTPTTTKTTTTSTQSTTSTSPTTTVTKTTTSPETSTPTTTKTTTSTRSTATSTSPTTTVTTTTTTPEITTPETSTPTTTKTTSPTTPSCFRKCSWSQWFDVSYPTNGTSGGDYETYENITKAGYHLCEKPENISCRAKQFPDKLDKLGQKVTCDVSYGLICNNKDQDGVVPLCYNYEISVYCCLPLPSYCLTTTPLTTTTTTQSTTTSASPTTTVTKTTTSPETSTPTTTKATTTSTQSTTSTSPTTTVTKTTTSPETSTPTTTKTTTSTRSTATSTSPTTTVTTTTTSPETSTPTTTKTTTSTQSTTSTSPTTTVTKTTTSPETSTPTTTKTTTTSTQSTTSTSPTTTVTKTTTSPETSTPTTTKTTTSTRSTATSTSPTTTVTTTTTSPETSTPTTTKTTTTSTQSTTSTSPTTTVTKTTTSPETSTPTTTKTTTSTRSTATSTSPTTTVTTTTTTPEITTPETSTPTTTKTTSPTTPSCFRKCSWSQWFDVSYPTNGTSGGDYETYENITKAGYHLCEKPENISCRAKQFLDKLDKLGQKVTCDVSYGLICNNKDQDGVVPLCYNYEISVYCCLPLPSYCLTTTPLTTTTTTQSTTTSASPTTTVTKTTTSPETSTPTTTKATTTSTQSTTSTSPTTTVTKTTTSPETSTPTTTKTTTSTRSTATSTSPTTTVTTTTTTPEITTPETSTPTTTKTTSPTTPSCFRKCSWSQWFDVSYPTNGTSGGDYETYENITKAGYHLCEKPENISCRAKQFPDKLDKLGQKVTCDVSYGLICNNKDQDGVVPLCYNYEISVYCCLPLPSYCLTTTPLTTTTTTQSTTTSASPTTTVTKTTTSPETSTPTTTKATTTSTQSTTSTSPTTTVTKTTTSPETSTPTTTKTTTSTRSTATSTSPTTTVTTTTTTPEITTPETSTPTTTKTTSPTTPSCFRKCSWSQWFDVSYPTNGTSGGDYETYENITKAGYHLCEKPENISCRAKQLPAIPLDKLGQKVTCDVSYGLICNNKDKDGVLPVCYNYEISVYCCLPLPSYCLTTTPVTTTTTTQSTTSTSPTTTVTKTTTSPETSTPTTTKTTTTSTQSTTSTSPTTTVTKTTTSPETSTPTTTKTTTSTRSTATSTSPTTTVTTTTTTPEITTPETSTPTTTKTTSPTTPSCVPKCSWSQWFDVSYPTNGASGGEYETYENITKAGYHLCEKPENISCRTKKLPDIPLDKLGQKVTCDVSYGLICNNKDQDGVLSVCYNYEISVYCCLPLPNYCLTTTPLTTTTTTQSTTSASPTTTVTKTTTSPETSTPTTTKATTTSTQSTTSTSPTTTVTKTTTSPETSTPTTTKTTTSTRSTATSTSPTTTVTTTTTTPEITTPETSTPTTTKTTSPTTPSCVPKCSWSQWFDVSYPTNGASGGEYETYENITKAGYHLCEKPENISCRTKKLPDIPLDKLGQKVTCDVSYGLICNNKDQDGVLSVCYNYEISVYCCLPLPNYCLTTTPLTTTTTTQSTTTSASPTTTVTKTTTSPETSTPTTTKTTTSTRSTTSTSPTTTVTKTTTSPETSTPTTTKTTTSTRSTATSTSPTTTVTTTTTTPEITTPETSTPTTTKTTSPTTPSCVPKCSWSQWFDVSYPTNGTSGGEYETYENITKAGYHLCEKPENISCRAKEFPYIPLDTLGQKVTCDVSYGLICNNKDQDEVLPVCYNYEISVYCCLPLPNYCLTTTPLTTTTTTQSTTTSASPTTTVTKTTTSPETSTPTTTKATTTTTQSTTSTSPTTTVTKTTTTPETSTPTTTKTTTSTQSTTTSTSPTTTVTITTTSSKTTTTAPTATKTTITASCVPKCSWSQWFDVSYPTNGTSGGEYETYENITKAGYHLCEKPENISCRAKEFPYIPLDTLGQKVTCDVSYGLICNNKDQDEVLPVCYNYEISVYCCLPLPNYCLTTTPLTTTTTTQSTTTSASPTTTVTKTTTSPETSTPTTTKATTTTTQSTTSTSPTTTVTKTTTTPETSTPTTTKTTTSTQSTTTSTSPTTTVTITTTSSKTTTTAPTATKTTITECIEPNGVIKMPGDNWIRNCYNCTCDHYGTIICTPIQCPQPVLLNCTNGYVVNVTDQNNPCCMKQVCRQHLQGCSLTPTLVTIKYNKCTSIGPVPINYCSGSCDSSTMFSIINHRMEQNCRCCIPTQTSEIEVSLECEDGSNTSYTYTDIEKCDCSIPTCKDYATT